MIDLNSLGDTVKVLFGNSKKTDSNMPQGAGRYSPALEQMISRAIEDDELTEEEIALLAKRAMKEGVDADEFEFDIRQRIKERKRNLERRANLNPVEALSNSLKAIEQYVKGGDKVVDGDALSAGLALIPGIGQAASIAGLVTSFIQSPSNRNELKAEVIRLFELPDNADYLRQFIVYANSQIIEEINRGKNNKSLKSLISSIAVGSEIDVLPIWEQKIEEACNMVEDNYSADKTLVRIAKENRPSLPNKLRKGIVKIDEIDEYDGKIPEDAVELVETVELLYDYKKGNPDDWDMVKGTYNRFYSAAERQTKGNPALMERLSRCRVKKFGFF